MNTRIHRSTILTVGAVALFFSQAIWSLGLGDATVESFLNQPLNASIQLITQESDSLDSISAGMASAEDYELIGASRDDISVPLQFSIEGSQGSSYISVRSDLPIADPVVRLIVEVNWTSGRMLREYTLFLDPPTVSQKAPPARSEPARQAPEAPSAEPTQPAAAEPATQTRPTATAAEPDSMPAATADYDAAANEYGPVRSGDTLWEIARDWSDSRGHNLNKVMLAIQRKNPRAFSRNNINLLQRGAILRMPDADEIDVMSFTAANSEVTEQSDAFKSRQYMTSPATPLLADESAAPEPPVSDETQDAATESEFKESDFLDKEMPGSETPASGIQDSEAVAQEPEPEPQLELVPPSQDSSLDSAAGFEESEDTAEASVTAVSLREELARKEEELITQQQQNAYLEQRLSELESQLEESKEGTLDDENLSSMEERLREDRLAAAEKETSIPKVTTSKPVDEPWYSGMTGWLIGLLVLVAAGAGWLMSRRGRSDEDIPDAVETEETLREIASEAEDVLRVLDSDEAEPGKAESEETEAEETEATDSVAEDSGEAPASEDEPQAKPDVGKPAVREEDAEILDEDSADPEIQLDLARAYISMGDKEAARVILDEVIANGTDEQQAEANKMKEFL
jgi:pilus assembly protein FimV